MKSVFISLLLMVAQSAVPAVVFDGVDDHLWNPVADDGSPVPLGSPGGQPRRTIAFWLKRYTTNSETIFLERHDTLANTFLDVRFNAAATNRLEYHYTDSGIIEQVFSSQPDVGSRTNVWIHFLIRHDWGDAAHPASMFVDGTEVNGSWTTGNGAGPPASSWDFLVGRTNQGTAFGHFFGELDEVCFWFDTYLNYDEIRLLAKSKMRGIGLQIQSTRPNGILSQHNGPGTSNPMDGFPDGDSLANRSTFRDFSEYTRYDLFSVIPSSRVNLYATNGPTCAAGRLLSYQPNE